MKDKDDIDFPEKLIKELTFRAVDAMRINVGYAKSKHEHGEEWAMSNNADLAVRAWLMSHVALGDYTPREAMQEFVEFASDVIFPAFLDTPGMEAEVQKDRDDMRDEVDDTVRDVLTDILGDDVTPIVAHGDSLDEIITKLVEMRDAQKETLQ